MYGREGKIYRLQLRVKFKALKSVLFFHQVHLKSVEAVDEV